MPAPTSESNPTTTTPIGHYFSDSFIQRVREAVLAPLGLPPDNNNDENLEVPKESTTQVLPYERVDIARLREDDWFIRRFLKWEPTSVEQAVSTMDKALIWRKRIGVNFWTSTTFPAEFYQVAACFSYLPDREGHPIIIVRLRFNKKEPHGQTAVEDLARHYFIHILEGVVGAHPNNGFGIIFDCSKASLSNVDLEVARFIINTMSNYYSGAISYVCIYELPWIFNQVWRLVRSWLDEDAKKIVKLATIKDIGQIIDPANLPDYMGGSASLNYRHIPKGVPALEEVAQSLGIRSQKDVVKLCEHFQKLLQLT